MQRKLVVVLVAAGFATIPATTLAEWHVVQPDETLWQIAEEYGVTSAGIAEANDIIDPNLISVGSELWIPGPDDAGIGGGSIIYVVESGDTVASIAAGFGVDTFALAMLNGIENPWTIFPGQELVVPIAASNPSPPVSTPSTSGSINYDVAYVDEAIVRSSIVELSAAYGWDAYLILSLAWKESTWEQRALSPSGAVGVMQLMPTTAEWAGPALVGRDVDYVNNAWDNIETGIAYLTHLRVLTGSDYLALAGYFQGLGSVERDGIFATTRDYALDIIERRDLFANGSLP